MRLISRAFRLFLSVSANKAPPAAMIERLPISNRLFKVIKNIERWLPQPLISTSFAKIHAIYTSPPRTYKLTAQISVRAPLWGSPEGAEPLLEGFKGLPAWGCPPLIRGGTYLEK